MANEKRLIDANALMKAIKSFRWFGGYPPNTLKLMFDYLKIIIDGQHTVDAVEVVHGRWIWSEENECWVCSNCEMSALNNYRGNSVDSNYCPNCGAKMDGDGNG